MQNTKPAWDYDKGIVDGLIALVVLVVIISALVNSSRAKVTPSTSSTVASK